MQIPPWLADLRRKLGLPSTLAGATHPFELRLLATEEVHAAMIERVADLGLHHMATRLGIRQGPLADDIAQNGYLVMQRVLRRRLLTGDTAAIEEWIENPERLAGYTWMILRNQYRAWLDGANGPVEGDERSDDTQDPASLCDLNEWRAQLDPELQSILRLREEGLSDRTIAARIGKKETTVLRKRHELIRKLGFEPRTGVRQ